MRQRLGQHFLRDTALSGRIVRALQAGPRDTIVEVGPGRGALTVHLAGRGARLILVERDSDLAARLRDRYSPEPTVLVLEDDAARVNLAALLAPPASSWTDKALVIGNLPYESSTAILSNLLRQRHLVARMVLMFQREVAARIAAPPCVREHGALSVLVQVRCLVEPLMDVGPSHFSPPPRVWSRVLRLTPLPPDHPFADAADDPAFEALVHALHAHPRKTVLNSLASGLGLSRERALALLDRAGVDSTLRPSHVPHDRVVALWRVCHEHGPQP